MGRWQRRAGRLRQVKCQAEAIDRIAPQWADLRDEQLQERLRNLRERCGREGARLHSETLIETAAALREAAGRKLGLRPYAVQLMGLLALNQGLLAEMETGEGKTLSVGLAAVVNVFRRRPCHVITVNDYLVTRDARRLRPFFEFCGAKSGFVIGGMSPEERRQAYRCEITYVTSKEVLADFLRDRLSSQGREHPLLALIEEWRHPRTRRLVLGGGLQSAIIDEADSILIDEAVTPLIISRTRENETLQDAVLNAAAVAKTLEPKTDYTVDAGYGEIGFTKSGERKLEELGQRLGGLWRAPQRCRELLQTALMAKTFFHAGKQYLIDRGKIVIVDEFTGRPMPQRTWRQGLHQAVEAKEGLAITAPSETAARMSFQRFFRGYRYLAGTTGTAREAASELWHIYNMPVMSIPPNLPCIRTQAPLQSFATSAAKWDAIVETVEKIHVTGRPVLVGTRNVQASEILARRLLEQGLACQVLNASRLAEEALIIAKAGEKGRITIATNMAGRGTDIVLDREVAKSGGLHVIVSEPHESHRIDRQLYGRAGRQGDPGSAQLFLSAEDEILQKYLSRYERHALRIGLTSWSLRRAQRRAERAAHKQRQRVLKMDDWLDSALSFSSSA